MTDRLGALLRGFTVLSLLGVLAGCGSDYVFVADPVFETLFHESDGVSTALSEISRDLNVSIDRADSLAIDAPLGSQAQELLASLEPERGAILSPLFFREASSLARNFPELAFLLLSEGRMEQEAPDNLLTVEFDRLDAFREAGRHASDHLRELEASIILLSLLESEKARREIRAFESQLPEGAISQRFVHSRQPERETIRQQIVSVGEGPHLWAVFLRGETAFALDLVAPRGEALIAEDLGPGNGYSELLLGSVERPYFQAMALGVAALEESDNYPEEITVSAVFQVANNDVINN